MEKLPPHLRQRVRSYLLHDLRQPVGVRDRVTRRGLYGLRISDAELIDSIDRAYRAWCIRRGLRFDGFSDQVTIGFAEALAEREHRRALGLTANP